MRRRMREREGEGNGFGGGFLQKAKIERNRKGEKIKENRFK